jgi:hypothetical protein
MKGGMDSSRTMYRRSEWIETIGESHRCEVKKRVRLSERQGDLKKEFGEAKEVIEMGTRREVHQ